MFLGVLRGLVEDAVSLHYFILHKCRMHGNLLLFNTVRREYLFPIPCLMHGLSLLSYGSALSQETCKDFMKKLSKNNWRCSVFFSSWE